MSKHPSKSGAYYTYWIDNRLYIIRRSAQGFYTTYIRQGA